MFEFLRQNLLLVGLVLVVSVVVAWAVLDARREESYREAAMTTADRTKRYTGGVLGFLGVVLYAFVGMLYQTGMSLGEGLDVLADLFMMSPELFAGVGVTLLAVLGLEGVLPVTAFSLGLVALLLFGAAYLAKRRGAVGEVSWP